MAQDFGIHDVAVAPGVISTTDVYPGPDTRTDVYHGVADARTDVYHDEPSWRDDHYHDHTGFDLTARTFEPVQYGPFLQ